MNDVLAITDTTGTIVGNYEYDAWGKVLTADTSIAQQNPLRYRGYYYDNETGYYYLQSRYYDSSICRFINSDNIKCIDKNSLSGINLFSYCNNNPINNSDYSGCAVGIITVAEIASIIVKLLLVVGICLVASYIINNTDFKPVISEIQNLYKSYYLKATAAYNLIKSFIKTSYSYAKSQIKSKTKAAARAVTIAVADAKVKTIVSRERKTAYWIAYIGNGYITLGSKISRNTAINRLKSGLCVFSTSKYNARNIATSASHGKTPYGPEKHGTSGCFWHYHLHKKKNSAHSFYL